MLTSFVARFLSSDRTKGRIYDYWYRFVNRTIGDEAVCFMNYGYDDDDIDLRLSEQDEPNRAYIQLYLAAISTIQICNRDVMEMSCGRGGGADYVARCLQPRSIVATDRTESAIRFCRRFHSSHSLAFVCGDAIKIPFSEGSFDVVVNIEASHCYPDLSRFLSEVRRILRHNGHFIYADFRKDSDYDLWQRQLVASGLEVVEQVDITSQVVRGLDRNNQRTDALVRQLAPRPLRNVFRQFAGTKGSIMHEAFKSRKVRYVRYVFRKH